jgi:hypothetical protein
MENDFTAKQKAQDLVTKFTFERQEHEKFVAKECAKICVDEILDGFRKLLPSSRTYWEQVKVEIEKL